MTDQQRILQLLYLARVSKKPYIIRDSELDSGKVWISGGWRPIWYFSGHSRDDIKAEPLLWELQDKNKVPIEMKNHNWHYLVSNKKVEKITQIYRLKIELYDLPFTNIVAGINATNFKWWKYKIKVETGANYPLFNDLAPSCEGANNQEV